MKQPLILEIKGNALDDGPGIRSVIFFKGCPLSCTWCHNPESKRAVEEIAFEAQSCVGCDTCIGICHKIALSRSNPLFIDRSICDLCFQCTDACPSGALSRIGKSMGVAEIVKQVVRDKPFYDTSGGGVTLSGGEPTMFMSFSSQLLQAFKTEGIHTLLETCGLFDLKQFNQKIYPWIDLIYFDIKLMNEEAHVLHCGVSNKTILSNFKALYKQAEKCNIAVIPRTPLIPGITDSPENIGEIVEFLSINGVRKAQLLPYHPLWQQKNLKIGIPQGTSNFPAMDQWLDNDVMTRCRNIFTAAGIETG